MGFVSVHATFFEPDRLARMPIAMPIDAATTATHVNFSATLHHKPFNFHRSILLATMKCSALAVSFLTTIGAAGAASGGNLRRRAQVADGCADGTWQCAPAADQAASYGNWVWKNGSPVEQVYARRPQCLNGEFWGWSFFWPSLIFTSLLCGMSVRTSTRLRRIHSVC